MSKKILFFILLFGNFFIANNLKAQSYQTAVGLRFGGLSSGLTVKHFVSKTSALEGILSVGRRSFIITGLYEKHTAVDNSKALNFYYGIGGHLGVFQDGGSYYYNDHRLYTSTTVVGIDGILGMGYTFKNAPINIGMDVKPFIDFYNEKFVYFDGAISLRYTF